jgi:hypothetical protein
MRNEERTLATFRKLRAEIEEDRRNRIQAHQLAVKKLGIRKRVRGTGPLNILAEGDSWFQYPLPPADPQDTISWLERSGSPQPLILNLAHWGDVATQMLGVTQRERIIKSLKAKANGPFDALLYSGGGNDLAGDQFCLWLKEFDPKHPDPANGIDRTRLDDIIGVVKAAYVDLIKIRDKEAADCVIFFNGYDFAKPDGRGVCGVGPWLQPSLKLRGWTDATKAERIVREVLLALDNELSQFEKAYENVVYVRTQGTLTQTHADWANELHPSKGRAGGFNKIAGRFLEALKIRFPNRV